MGVVGEVLDGGGEVEGGWKVIYIYIFIYIVKRGVVYISGFFGLYIIFSLW